MDLDDFFMDLLFPNIIFQKIFLIFKNIYIFLDYFLSLRINILKILI